MSVEKLFAKIARLFNKLDIPYMLVGGFAVAFWGYPRQSLDIDVVVELNESNVAGFINRARQAGFKLHEAEINLVVGKGNRFVMEADDFRIDCWLPRSQFELQALKKRKNRKLFGKTIPIISAEDLIISKLLISRPRDLEDIKTILLRQKGKLNNKYLNYQAAAIGKLRELKKII